MLNAADWKSVFEAYATHPGEALDLARQLMDIRKLLQRGSRGNAEAIAAIDAALGALYEHTSFNRVGQKFYQLCIEARLTAKQEDKLRELGVKF
jgi:hypothetical protein